MTPARSLPSPEQRRAFEERGLFFTDVLFTEDELAPVREACARAHAESLARDGADLHRQLRPFLPRMHVESDAVAAFLRHPVFASLALALVGPDADQAWNQACIKHPDAGAVTLFPYHQDCKFARLDDSDSGFACFVALRPLDVENGTLHFAAGAHRRELEHRWHPEANWWECAVQDFELVPGILEPGAMVVYHPMTPHGSPPNRSGAPREAFLASFARPGIRLVETGELFGDQRPLLRGGEPVREPAAP